MGGCRYLFVLCGLPTLPTNIKVARSYAERMFTSFQIGNLSKDGATEAISEPLKKAYWKFSNELIRSIVRDTAGYPYFIQFFCSEIIMRINNSKKNIDLKDYEKIKDSIQDKLSRDFFDRRLDPLTNGQIRVLYTMANLQIENISFSSIQKSSNIAQGPLSHHLKTLEDKNLIYRPKRGIYRFPTPLFQEYLKKKQCLKKD